MYRTTIVLPPVLKAKFEAEAKRQKTSFGKLVRVALQKYLLQSKSALSEDSFLASKTLFSDAQSDVSQNHDIYLNEVEVHGKLAK